MFGAFVRALGRVVKAGTIIDTVPAQASSTGLYVAARADVASRPSCGVVRPMIALSALAIAAMPCAAAAESAACTAINNGELNYSANFSSTTAAPSPAGRTAGIAATASGIRSASYTATTGTYQATYAGFSPTLYDFDANEQITFTVRTISVSGSSFRAFFPVSNTTPGSATSAPGILLASVGTITQTLTTDAGTNAILARIQRGSTADTGSFTMTATCVGTPPPAISSIAPTSGPAAGGTSITINGSNFTGVDQVRFDTSLVSVTPTSDTQITVAAPAHAAGPVGVAVLKNGAASAVFNSYTYIAAPSVTSVAPASGGAAGGNSVTVTGTGFTGATAVSFGGSPAASFTVNSATQITATAPAGSGTVNVTVTTPGGTSATGAGNQYRYVAAPTISAISPTGGSSGGGTPVTITGTDFVSGNSYSASFGATTVPATYASATTLTATAPAGAGTVAVGVTDTTTGQTSTGSVNYTYAAPTVTALSVTSGPANASRAVTITGTNFTPTATVSVGGTAATGVSYVSATQLSATLPAKAAGTYDVLVTTGSVTSATGPASQYSYIAAPTITSATPSSGSTAGGTSVTITGTGLTGASAVTFGGNAATSFTVTGDTQITAVTPAGGAGATSVAVTTPGGTATLANGYSYVVLNPPAVTTQPASQTVAVGATASFTAGASGSPSPSVQWQVSSDSGASFTNIAGATAATYTTPATTAGDNGRQYRAVFTNSQGSATSSAATLTAIQAPTANARSVTATFNTATAVTLTGSDPNTPARTLTYAIGTPPTHGTLSGTLPNLTYTPAANYIGTDSFTFTVSNGLATSSAATVTITVAGPPAPAAPVLTSPANGSTLNTATPIVTGVTASGTTVEVFIDGTLNGNASVSGGNFTYTVASALGQGSHSVYAVASALGVASAPSNTNAFAIDTVAPAAPVITAPANGATLANRRPAITGTAESNASLAIRINGAAAGTTSATAGGTYSYAPGADLPLGSNTVSVTATDAAGNASSPATNSFTIVALPTVSAVTPAEGGTAGGTTITVTGNNFTSDASVTVGGTPATGVSVASATRLTAVTPTGTAGPATVQVTNTAGVSATNGSFTYIGAPTATAQTVSTAFQTARSIVLAGTDANTPARPLSYAITAAPARGTLSGTAPNLTYTPAAGVRGTDSFTFTASNGVSTSAPATVTVTIGDPTLTIAAPPASGTVGTPYTATLTTTGGTATYSYAVTAGALPTGLTLAASGTLSGEPASAGNFAFTVTAEDSTGGSPPVRQSQAFTITIGRGAQTVRFTSTPPAGAIVGGTYLVAASASSGLTPAIAIDTGARAICSITGNSVRFDQVGTCVITASQAGDTSFDPAPAVQQSIAIGAPTITVSPATVPTPQVGIAYSQRFTASGGTAPYSFAVTAGALPTGLTLANDGTLSGTPSAAGSFTYTITATDSASGSSAPFVGQANYTTSVQPPVLTLSPAANTTTSTALPAATGGMAYTQTITTSGGIAPYSYSVVGGALPPGLTLASGGVISGTPSAAGTFDVRIGATDSGAFSVEGLYAITVAAPTIVVTPSTLPPASVGQAYDQTLAASGAGDRYSYTVVTGALPAGVTLTSDGRLAGTPTAGGSFAFTLRATNAAGFTGERAYTLTVATATVTLAPASLPAGASGMAYSETLSATGGNAPYSYAVTAGALPTGVTLSSSGALAGTPTQSGSFTFSITATDSSTGSGPYSATRSYTLVIAAPALTLAPATLANATVGTAYSQALTASGGTAPYSYAISAGTLPAGVTLGTNGTLSGTPTSGGSYSFTVTVTDATATANGGPYTASRGYMLTVAAATVAFGQASLPAGVSGATYSETLSATGGTAPYAYAVTAGALPAGVTLSSSGTLSGTPTQSGSFVFSVTATDSSTGSGPYSATRSYTLSIAAPTLTLAPAALTNATVGSAYSASLTASGGTAPYSYAVTVGTLPTGVTLGTNGTLRGTPTAGGSYSFTVTVTDATATANGGPYTIARNYTLTVATATVALAPTNVPAGASGTAYSQTLSASGGTAPYSYAVTAGALPAGVTLSSNGMLAGTPTQSGSFHFSVTATDSSTGSGPYSATRSYTLSIAAPALTLDPAALANATVGAAYSQALTASGGTAPYSYAVTTGTLPTGVTLSTNGTLSGTPTAGGSYTFTVTATDATVASNGGPYTASRSYTLNVATATVAFGQASLPAGVSGAAYSEALSATGGTAPYSYAVTAGALPTGVTLSSNGMLAGTPTQSGSFTFSITATDSSTGSGPYRATRSYTLSIAAPALALDPAALANATVGAAYSQAVTATGGTAPYSYAVTAGALPAGIGLATNGALSGTPTAGGSYSFTITATDATATGNGGPYTTVRGYTLVVAAASVAVGPASLPDGRYEAAYKQALTASGGTAPYRYAVTDGALPAGVTLAADGTLSGTPSAFGRFAFTVTATDSSTGAGPYSGAKAYSLVIAAPDVPVAANVSLAVGYGAAATAVPLKVSGGAATGVAIASAPAHGTATVNGTAISYTPAAGYAGADSFTYTASNAGGASAPATVSITVAQPSLALTPTTLPAGQEDVAYSQQLTTSGGTAPYAYAVTAGRLPAGVTLSPGGLLAGTPQESGRYNVTVTATDSSSGNGPFTATNAYTLDIALPAPPVARPGSAATSTATTTQNGAVAIDLSALITGDYRQIRITAQPQHGTVSIDARQQDVTETNQRITVTYTPEPGYIGEDGFGYVAIGAGGTSNEARVAVTVKGSAPVAPAVKASVTNGQTQIVDLTGGAIGGPFLGATIVSVTPADGVEATLVESGSTGDRRYQLRITPRGRFSGSATVRYTLTNAYGTSAPAAVSVSVVQRADPSQDATVTGISAAQAEATRRFAQAQLDNFQRRNEQLHNGGAGSVGRPMGVNISGGNSYGGRDPNTGMAATDLAMLKSDHATAVMGRERAAGMMTYDRDGRAMPVAGLAGARSDRAMGQTMAGDPATRTETGEAEAVEGVGRSVGSTAIWSGGAIALGTQDATRGRGKLTVSTGGLSSGVDVKLSEALTVGIGGGYGGERAKVGKDQGRVDSNSWMGAVYGSVAPADGLFLDGVAGAGRLSFDTIRNVTGGDAVARGHRGGSMLFGSLTGGFDRTSGTHALSAYGRIDYLSADLDRYTETGAGNANLVFDGRRLTSLSSVLGLRGSLVTGRFVPRVRAEWRHEFKNGGIQALDYADLGGFNYAIRGDGWTRDNYAIELGTDYVFDNGWRIGFDLGGALGQGSRYATEKITIRKQF